MQNGRTKAEFLVYLDRYPDGRFADVARAKMAALDKIAVRPAAAAAHPMDGDWKLVWEVVGKTYSAGFCGAGEEAEAIVAVTGGTFKSKVTSNHGSTATVKGVLSETRAILNARSIRGWANQRFRAKLNPQDDGFAGRFRASYCAAELSLTRM